MSLRPLFVLAAIAALAGNSLAQKPVAEPASKQVKQDDPKKPTPKTDPAKPAASTSEPEEKPASGLAGLIAGAGGLFCFAVYCLLVLIFGMLPTMIAFARSHANAVPILLVNLFLGWTCLGWFAALVWSFTSPAASTTVIIEDRPGRRRRREDDYE